MAQRRRRKKSWISWLILVILLAGAVAMIVLVRNNLFGEKDEPAPVKETSIGEKKYPVEKKEEQDGQSKKDVVEKSEEDQEEDSSLTGVVTYAGKIEDVLMIRVNIDQFLSEGTCTLNLEKDGEIVYGEMVEIIDSAATATCEGFNVPAHSFGAGNYKIVIKLKAGEQNGIINGEVSL